MNSILTPDSVTVIRKKDDAIYHEDIATCKMLPGIAENEQQVRINTIARLRKDPSVIAILDGKNGRCKEAFEYKGFIFNLVIQESKKSSSAQVKIIYSSHCAYEKHFVSDAEECSDYNTAIYKLIIDVERILRDIDEEYYEFVSDDCPGFISREPEEEVESMEKIAELLEKNNFQVEKLYTIDYAITPCLFVYENDVMLIGERHFSGQFFVEMKRIWTGVSARIIAKAIEDTDTGTVSCFQYEDGSWGIRTTFYDNVFESNFEKLLNMAINEVRAVVEKIENKPGIGPEVFSVANAQRSLFIYEVIDASLKLSKLHI